MENYFSFDAAYLARLRDRDQSTLDHFCEYFYLPVRNKVKHNFPGRDIDDVVQDVFVAAIARIDRGEPRDPQKLPGYVFGVCRHLILREFSGRKRVPIADVEISGFADLQASIETRLIQDLNRRRVQRILARLSERDREAINREFMLINNKRLI